MFTMNNGVTQMKSDKQLFCPLLSEPVSAGFPSPAGDYIEQNLDLNEHLIKSPSSTYFMKVDGNSMIDASIYSGDLVIVDKSINAKNDDIVIAVLDGGMTIKRLKIENENYFLLAENKKYPKIKIEKESDFSIWGVVTYIIHKAH